MSNILQHPQFGEIRIRKERDNYFFCIKDVCEILGHTNPSIAIQMLDEDERVKKSLGRQGEAWFCTESGLYVLILRSNKPMAKKFRKWVTGEVLPALRKYGVYSTDPRIIQKAQEKAERAQVGLMLKEVASQLSRTDVKLVAKQCRTTEWQVDKVLKGEVKDPYMLQLLYARATGNKLLSEQFYTAKGAEALLQRLIEIGNN
jgi:hypothetical protein